VCNAALAAIYYGHMRSLLPFLAFLSAVLVFPLSLAAAPDDPARAIALDAATQLERFYVFPSRAQSAAAMLRANEAAGAYDGLSGDDLARRLTSDLAPVLHDQHVRVHYSIDVLPPASASGTASSPEESAAEARFQREIGYGLGRVAHLPGNVGYLDLRFFPSDSPESNAVIDGMANAVAYSNAIVLDLRRNGGGDSDGIARLLSHFLPPKTHLNDFLGRGDADARVTASTYTAVVPGPPIAAPLFVLTSSHTFSGAEECAYDVQALKRATLVGEVTGGGANPGRPHRLDDHFDIFVPSGRARNPITQTNWEGTGVKPDVAVSQDRALATAYAMALTGLGSDTALGTEERTRLEGIRSSLPTMDDAKILSL